MLERQREEAAAAAVVTSGGSPANPASPTGPGIAAGSGVESTDVHPDSVAAVASKGPAKLDESSLPRAVVSGGSGSAAVDIDAYKQYRGPGCCRAGCRLCLAGGCWTGSPRSPRGGRCRS